MSEIVFVLCSVCEAGSVSPLFTNTGERISYCDECDAMWDDHLAPTNGEPGTRDPERFSDVDLSTARRAHCQDLCTNDPQPSWRLFHSNVDAFQFPSHGVVVDHSSYVLSVGGCLVCDSDRVLAWVTVSGRLVFRCPDGHENTTNSDGVGFPLWWVPDSGDPSVAAGRYANAGDIAAIIEASGPRSTDDDELALFDVKWAILPRPADS